MERDATSSTSVIFLCGSSLRQTMKSFTETATKHMAHGVFKGAIDFYLAATKFQIYNPSYKFPALLLYWEVPMRPKTQELHQHFNTCFLPDLPL